MIVTDIIARCEQINKEKPFVKRFILSREDYDAIPKANPGEPADSFSGISVTTSVFLLPGYFAIEDTDGNMYLYAP